MPNSENLNEKHVLALTIDNEAGALGRVVGLFSGRGYNINSLTVSEVDGNEHLSRITITTEAPPNTIKHIITLLERLVPVHKVRDLTVEGNFVQRGVLLIKVAASGDSRSEVLRIAEQFDANEVDSTSDTFVFEVTDIPAKLNEFVVLMQPYGVVELARTGITALSRGSEEF